MIRKRAINCCIYILSALFVRTSFGGYLASQPLPLPTPKAEQTTVWLGLWDVCLALLVIVGLLFVIRWLFGRMCGGKTPIVGSKQRNISIVERKPLGGRQSLLLVRCRDTEVLLHQSKGRLSTLCVLDAEKREETT
ncbi:MAG: FliO/MopB family protein [Phycisphaerae bacterium]|nr:FliO/MopB family protein [Phycisphaerae bacterium]